MILDEKTYFFPRKSKSDNLLSFFTDSINEVIENNDIPVRFVVTETSSSGYRCEIGILTSQENLFPLNSIFEYRQRKHENFSEFNSVVIVPTGIGASLGGHSGDAGAMLRLMSAVCDNVITHPNVVNAADINEIPDNALYVEGSVISRLLMGAIGLQKVRSNRILTIIDEHENKMFHELAINSVSAARVALGLNSTHVIKMEDTLLMRALFSKSGRAVGRVEHLERLCQVLREYSGQYDAVALSSLIQVPKHFHYDYFMNDMEVNPWGGVEAMLTHAISLIFNIPSAHSPMMTSIEILNMSVGVVDPRKAAETVSMTYLHCILKGLHRSPRIVDLSTSNYAKNVLTAEDVSCIVMPYGCLGLPTLASLEQGIPVIAVKENVNCMKNILEELPFPSDKLFVVNNYTEAAGVMVALKAGIDPLTARRPLKPTTVRTYKSKRDKLLEKT